MLRVERGAENASPQKNLHQRYRQIRSDARTIEQALSELSKPSDTKKKADSADQGLETIEGLIQKITLLERRIRVLSGDIDKAIRAEQVECQQNTVFQAESFFKEHTSTALTMLRGTCATQNKSLAALKARASEMTSVGCGAAADEEDSPSEPVTVSPAFEDNNTVSAPARAARVAASSFAFFEVVRSPSEPTPGRSHEVTVGFGVDAVTYPASCP